MNVSLFDQVVEVVNESNQLLTDVIQAGARRDDPDTTHLAAKNKASLIRWGNHRTRLLETYYGSIHGLTDEESAALAGLTPPASSSPWKRSSELREHGHIVDTGERAKSSFGADVMICKITQKGIAAFEAAKQKESKNQ